MTGIRRARPDEALAILERRPALAEKLGVDVEALRAELRTRRGRRWLWNDREYFEPRGARSFARYCIEVGDLARGAPWRLALELERPRVEARAA
jgi:hypothetical protein